MLGRNVLCPPTLTPRRKTTSAIEFPVNETIWTVRDSEHQLGPELDHARSHALHSAADGAERCRADVSVDRGRIRVEMICQVEDFRPEFEESSLLKPKRLVYREVCVLDTRQPDGIGPRRRAEAAEGRFDKRRGVEPTFPRALV